MDEQIKPVAWVCTKATDGTESFREPFLATNVAYVNTHKAYDWSPLYSQQSIDALRAEVKLARDGWHMANGVADLAMKHRDAAESRAERAEAEAEALRRFVEEFRHAVKNSIFDDGEGDGPMFTTTAEWAHNMLEIVDAARKGAEEVRYTITPKGREMLNGG